MPDPLRILIAESRYYADIAALMRAGARAVLEAAGAEVTVLEAPGSFELPTAIAYAAGLFGHRSSVAYDGFLALGCVIRGETSHYDHVCAETARGIQELGLRHGLAVGFGVLTCENGDQAHARAAIDQKDKGGEAARACLRMIELRRRFQILT